MCQMEKQSYGENKAGKVDSGGVYEKGAFIFK